MFVDEKTLFIKAGKGGDGATLFRREKYVPYGGPDGGDGGKGGDVIILAQHNLHALNHLARTDRFEAQDGQGGMTQRMTGHNGENTIIQVPVGTILEKILEDGSLEQIIELTEDGQTLRIAKGGNGGWGNCHFRSSIQQAPLRHNDGLPGESLNIKLTLKLIADVGLVGLPNAGKSTLLSSISAARPKIANYPFTTLEPQLGVAEIRRGKDVESFVIADLPGLIEGASEGKGLGVTFLKHVERTKMIIHCLDCSLPEEEIFENYKTIRGELEKWSEVLSTKPERIALTKCELLPEEDIAKLVKKVAKQTKREVFAISAIAKRGLTELLTGIR